MLNSMGLSRSLKKCVRLYLNTHMYFFIINYHSLWVTFRSWQALDEVFVRCQPRFKCNSKWVTKSDANASCPLEMFVVQTCAPVGRVVWNVLQTVKDVVEMIAIMHQSQFLMTIILTQVKMNSVIEIFLILSMKCVNCLKTP